MKKIKLYIKILISLIKKNVVTNIEYGESYNDASYTYDRWIELMGKHVDPLIHADWFDEKSKIIDLACGTGYISRNLINGGYQGNIIGVDISSGMLKRCEDISSDRIAFHRNDAIEFLEDLVSSGEKVDGIFLGWAFPYMNQKRLLNLVYRALKTEGYFIVISNCSGTLENIERCVLNVMADHNKLVDKPMEARIKLPKSSSEFKSKIEKQGLKCVDVGDGEEIKEFEDPESLYIWLMETGALAGVDKVFKDISKAKPFLIQELRRNNRKGEKFVVNHKFVYGIFRKSEGL